MNEPRPLSELLAAAEEAADLERQLTEKKKAIGGTFSAFRNAHNLSQASLGEMLGKKQAYISQIEHGERTPSSSTLNSFIDLANNYNKGDINDEEKD